jgi:hypothetical protein
MALPLLGLLGGLGGGSSALSGISGQPQLANYMAMVQMQTSDLNQAQTIGAQIAVDTKKQQLDRWNMMQALQTSIFSTTQDVTVSKAKAADKAMKSMTSYIQG